jgi:PPOX class probable FMN-dependent enzyme
MAVETRESLRARLGEPGDAARGKLIGQLDQHCADILALSPFAVVATSDAAGRCDASPRGGPPGFVRKLSPRRVAIGELPGNRLFDGAQNLAENPHAALLVMIPGANESLRIEGRAHLSTDEDVRAATALDGRVPWGALVIDVERAFVHCGKALVRSRLWQPSSWPAPEERPRMGAVLAAHIAAPGPEDAEEAAGPGRTAGPAPTAEDVEADLEEWYTGRHP